VPGASPESWNDVASFGALPISRKPEEEVRLLSMRWPVSLLLGSTQVRLIWLDEMPLAERDEGATNFAPKAVPESDKNARAASQLKWICDHRLIRASRGTLCLSRSDSPGKASRLSLCSDFSKEVLD
jgi:hypothetical protein